jgi:SAM-dependent methyltransferase
MPIAQRTLTFMRGFLLSYGPSGIKKMLWDKEFSSTKWNFIDNTEGDCVYFLLEKYARNGDVLDLGCGPGNTANEMADTVYKSYVGVDISDAALAKAVKRTQESGRTDKNTFVTSDFMGYQPTREFDVILFRESMYHIPYGQVRTILDKYSKHLKPEGVFVVRLFAAKIETGKIKHRVTRKLDLIKREFDMVEAIEYSDIPGRPTVLVFRPRRRS